MDKTTKIVILLAMLVMLFPTINPKNMIIKFKCRVKSETGDPSPYFFMVSASTFMSLFIQQSIKNMRWIALRGDF